MLIKLTTFFLICLKLALLGGVGAAAIDDPGVSQTLEIIRSRGFGGEEYHIKSYDGYPLTVYHIINPYADQRTVNKYPVIIFHGLGGDSTQMISHSVDASARKPIVGQLTALAKGDECLAFMLSNNNYDVWLIDSRGVNLNNRNASVDTNFFESQKFWKYSLDEQIFNDVPKLIDFVLEQTQTPKALLVTYSESTFFLFALLAAAPDYSPKIASLVALAPTVYVEHLRGLAVPAMLPFLLTPESIDGNYAPQPMVDTVVMLTRRLCSLQVISSVVCRQTSQAIAGRQESNSESADFFSTLAKGSSIRTFKHFAQMSMQHRFGMYDYGPQVNLLKYGQPAAPNYDLAKVRLPTVVLFRAGNDFLSSVPDQERLIRELGVKPMLDIKLPNYNHLDFIINSGVTKDVNYPIAQVFAQVLLNDAASPATLTRNPSLPLAVGPLKPDTVVGPRESLGRIINSPVHLVRNLVNSLELKQRLGFLLPPTIQGGQMTKGLDSLVDNVDRLASSLNGLPDLIQAQANVAY